ncbi:hypothetical protein VM1G_01236 [Cytospora mali]|uniref:Uncharacterized protein n=1 Tax=Cytospora mali TaxID=578113 RepID=A0A194VNK5_CYTMA|nr:hypothetical protein VM1G_01236 [Valsa mali]
MMADNDWQEAAFNTRHLHNRNDRGGQGGNNRHEFQPSNTFGSHLVKCAAMEKLQPAAPEASVGASAKSKKKGGNRSGTVLEVYRLTDDEDGLLGSLVCAGVFEASVVFAGSRKLLWKIWQQLGGTGGGAASADLDPTDSKGKAKEQIGITGVKKSPRDDDSGDDSGDEEEPSEANTDAQSQSSSPEGRQQRRASTFEKNSFRHPKFWFRWQGEMADDKTSSSSNNAGTRVHGSGYIVFSGNDCKRFQGTITSEQLGWNNVKISGWKARPQPERDFEIQWGES